MNPSLLNSFDGFQCVDFYPTRLKYQVPSLTLPPFFNVNTLTLNLPVLKREGHGKGTLCRHL